MKHQASNRYLKIIIVLSSLATALFIGDDWLGVATFASSNLLKDGRALHVEQTGWPEHLMFGQQASESITEINGFEVGIMQRLNPQILQAAGDLKRFRSLALNQETTLPNQSAQPNLTEQTDRPNETHSSPALETPTPPGATNQEQPNPSPAPLTVEMLYREATTLYKAGNYPSAIALYRQIIRQQPTYLNAYISLGNALDDQGNDREAIAVYNQALKLRPTTSDHAFVHYNLGVTYYRRQEFPKAVQAFEQAIALRRNFTQAYEVLGQTWEELGNLPAARRVYERLIQVEAQSAHAHWRLGIILGRQNRKVDSVKMLQRARQLYIVAGNSQMASQVEQLLQQLGN